MKGRYRARFCGGLSDAERPHGPVFWDGRFDNSGNSTAGFWFLQDSTVDLTNTKSGGGFLFSGHHSNKDLLIISDFTTEDLPQELKPSPQLRHCAGLAQSPPRSGMDEFC